VQIPLLDRRYFLRNLAGASIAAPVWAQAPVSIDTGRQLLVDDLLVGETTLRRTFHKPRIHPASPILKPETPLEMNNGYCPVACPFSDGVFYDPKDRLFKMWYHAGWFDGVAYAISEDGIRWKRPNLDVEPGTNRVLPRRDPFQRDGACVWLDQETTDRSQRFKMFVYFRERGAGYRYGTLVPPQGTTVSAGGWVYTSSDGVHWSRPAPTGPCGDNTSFFYDPYRKVWMYSIRTSNKRGRVRSYRQTKDFVQGARWTKDDMILFATADDQDLPDPKLGYETQLYRVEAVGYESLMLSVWLIHRGPPNEICEKGGFPKITDITLAYSRDGIHWDRPDRTAFLACTQKPGDWNRGYLHPAGGVCLVVGDELYFYFGAWSGISPKLGGHMYAGASTGLAILRRDGFASLDAGSASGSLTTVPVTFSGRHLFVNANAKEGEVTVEMLGPDGEPVAPFTRQNCRPLRADKTCQRVVWNSAEELPRLHGRTVSFRFYLTRAQLFSFWISADESGASHGYVAAGGPGFTGPTDTVGSRSTQVGKGESVC
jgi:hypothetical protein